MNIKPFVCHFCLVMLGTGIIGAGWNSARNEVVFVAFLLMLLLHYAIGFLLNNHHSWYKNLLSVSMVFVINFALFMYTQFHNNDLQSFVDFASIVFKFPFLYVLGWKGPNYPLLVSFLPSVLLWLGLESKFIIKKFKIDKDKKVALH
ncbi:hypothetical protein [Halobacillus seohaensis]